MQSFATWTTTLFMENASMSIHFYLQRVFQKQGNVTGMQSVLVALIAPRWRGGNTLMKVYNENMTFLTASTCEYGCFQVRLQVVETVAKVPCSHQHSRKMYILQHANRCWCDHETRLTEQHTLPHNICYLVGCIAILYVKIYIQNFVEIMSVNKFRKYAYIHCRRLVRVASLRSWDELVTITAQRNWHHLLLQGLCVKDMCLSS